MAKVCIQYTIEFQAVNIELLNFSASRMKLTKYSASSFLPRLFFYPCMSRGSDPLKTLVIVDWRKGIFSILKNLNMIINQIPSFGNCFSFRGIIKVQLHDNKSKVHVKPTLILSVKHSIYSYWVAWTELYLIQDGFWYQLSSIFHRNVLDLLQETAFKFNQFAY